MAQTPREWEASGLAQGNAEELGQRQNPNRFLPLWQEGFPGPHQVEPHRDTAWRGTKPLAMAPLTQALPLACLLLLLLGSAPGADAQAGFQLHQPQKEVSVIAGETLTLSCTVTTGGPSGPVKWLKGWGSGSETIYDQKDPSSSRGMRAVIDSNTDFTILIRDVRPEDTGTYYCVKFRKASIGVDELYRRGNGTVVVVQGADAQAGQGFQLHQPQREVFVRVGETLTLICTVTGGGPLGPVKWLKGWGSGSETIFDQKDPSSSRGMKAVDESNTDHTILIRDVRPEDTGTYYCVKFRKGPTGDELYRRGNGTVVVVQARPSNPTVSGPSDRVEPGKKASFTCISWGFFPGDISVKWFKDKTPIQSQLPNVTPGPSNFTYSLSSIVTVTLQKDDIRSELTCQVLHTTLTAPLTRSYHLSQILRVPPKVVLEPPGLVGLNETVSFTCDVQGFYPGSVTVTWLENGKEMNTGCTPGPIETPEGLFELRSTVSVQAVLEKNGSVFTCRVVHEGQDPLSSSATLWVAASGQQGPSSGGAHLLSSPGLWLCMLLDKAILGLVLFFLFKRWQA
ncbi:signal-regulatory protein beta-1-like isoform X2 [Anas acuta]|uniref:signal-regulatory protein beta-1-like isoform X2 n=1 Tax=Anas acuta TaxID=28680 RepID=UPI0035C8B3B9